MKYSAIASSFQFNGLANFLPDILSFPVVTIENDEGDTLITGRAITQGLADGTKTKLMSVSGYSLPGILEDCPVFKYPLQFDNMSLREIVESVLAPFGIDFLASDNVYADFNTKYKKQTATPTHSAKSFLNTLASQKNILMSHNSDGQLLFTRIDINSLSPVAKFEVKGTEYTNIALTASGQQMHSVIRVVRQADKDTANSGEYEIMNPYVDVYRPTVQELRSGTIYDVEAAARAELAKELRGIKIVIDTLTFVSPGNIIQVKSEKLEIYKLTNFFVEQTSINGNEKGEKYTLTCSLIDVYTTGDVINIFSQ